MNRRWLLLSLVWLVAIALIAIGAVAGILPVLLIGVALAMVAGFLISRKAASSARARPGGKD